MAQQFKPGEVVLHRAVYWVIHTEHRQRHLNELRAGETFPRCKQCGDGVRFELLSVENSYMGSKAPTQ